MATPDALEIARACASHMLRHDRASAGLGMQVDISKPGSAEVRMQITRDMLNGHGICHGGYLFTLADSAFAFACNAYNRISVSASASADYLAPARQGDDLIAVASEIWRSKRHGLYDVIVVRSGETRPLVQFRGRCVEIGGQVLPAT